MAKRSSNTSAPEPRRFTSAAEIDDAIKKINRRIEQMERLAEPGMTYDRPERKTAESDIRTTILEVFGPKSPEYLEHQHHRIWYGPMYTNSGPEQDHEQFIQGIVHTHAMLEGLVRRLEEQRIDLPIPTSSAAKAKPAAKRRIFIGHGSSRLWLTLKDFLVDRLGLEYDEFNREAAAGYTTKERLLQMLDATAFALLVMTAEDEHSDGTRHARENVIHEVGLFQGRHGFERAIVLLEDGCAEFSNVKGLTQIRFPKGDILARSEEIRRVLERERLLTR